MPIFIVLGAALVGVLVEAVVPPAQRFVVQVWVALLGFAAALIDVIAIHSTSILTAADALAVDGVALFMQGTILALAIPSTLLIAERSVDTGSAVVAQAAVVAGSPADRQ